MQPVSAKNQRLPATNRMTNIPDPNDTIDFTDLKIRVHDN